MRTATHQLRLTLFALAMAVTGLASGLTVFCMCFYELPKTTRFAAILAWHGHPCWPQAFGRVEEGVTRVTCADRQYDVTALLNCVVDSPIPMQTFSVRPSTDLKTER